MRGVLTAGRPGAPGPSWEGRRVPRRGLRGWRGWPWLALLILAALAGCDAPLKQSIVQTPPAAAHWVAIASGGNHSLGVMSDGTLWAWGANGSGQLGDGTLVGKAFPVQIGTGTTWTVVAAGANHSLALQSDGSLWAWGSNTSGQVGDGSGSDQKAPVHLKSGSTFLAIAGGASHSLAVRSDHSLWGWGDNSKDQIDSTGTMYTTPTQIGTVKNWSTVAAGGLHSLGVQQDATLWAWGDDSLGQTGGGGTSASPVSSPTKVAAGPASGWSQVAAGSNHSVGLGNDGTVWAWGDNSVGQAGSGATGGTVNQPTQPVSGPATWSAVATGADTTVGLATAGTLWAWGSNNHGQLGNASLTDSNAPVKEATAATDWSALDPGGSGTHTLALKSGGTLWGWGNNASGQLGDGTLISHSTATQIQ